MARKHANSFSGLESGVSRAIKNARGGSTGLVDSVAGVFAGALRSSALAQAALFDEAPALAQSAVRGASRAGGDLGHVARGFLLGALRGCGLEGEPALQAAGEAAGAFITSARAAGGDAAGAAMGLIEGVMVWAGEVGQDAARAASVAGQSAVEAAYEADARTGRKVRDALRTRIAGIEIVLRDPAKDHKRSTTRRPRAVSA